MESVKTSLVGHVLVITLNRPAQRNALDLEMRLALGRAVEAARDDSAVKAVVIAGEGGTFCAGGDLRSLTAEQRSPHADRDRVRRLHLWFRELVNMEKPVIAAVDGAAYGAGFNLALAADFILATPRARLCQVFGRIGVVPDLGGLFLLPRIVGLQRAKEIVFSARELSAEQARALGIVMAIHPPESLMLKAMELAACFENAGIEALGMAKNILNRSFNLDQDTLSELESYAQSVARHTPYHKEAVRRFLAKEPLRFNWHDPKVKFPVP